MPPTLELSTQLSQVMFAHPYPSPKPIQKPSCRCGYCARAPDAAQENAASNATTRVVCMRPPWRVSVPGSGEFHARGGEHEREAEVSSRAVRQTPGAKRHTDPIETGPPGSITGPTRSGGVLCASCTFAATAHSMLWVPCCQLMFDLCIICTIPLTLGGTEATFSTT